ncbi:hypothetical protein PNO24_06865 [Gemella haemolysans]|uniref:hypothetical protein n=1 Tax=Gemella haemolysans TaxID=1379 RepID=UPI00232EC74F|nr:hypothetical protein [Gemella haemolysans]MDB6213625.1 hypothetical protein [Gemella haemolysans]
MLILKLVKINNNVVVYNYFPENAEDYGTIELDLVSKDVRLVKRADKYKQTMYLMHAYQGILRMLDENDFLDTRVVAWY